MVNQEEINTTIQSAVVSVVTEFKAVSDPQSAVHSPGVDLRPGPKTPILPEGLVYFLFVMNLLTDVDSTSKPKKSGNNVVLLSNYR